MAAYLAEVSRLGGGWVSMEGRPRVRLHRIAPLKTRSRAMSLFRATSAHADDRNADDRNADDRNADDRNADDQNTGYRVADDRTAAGRTTDDLNAHDRNSTGRTAGGLDPNSRIGGREPYRIVRVPGQRSD